MKKNILVQISFSHNIKNKTLEHYLSIINKINLSEQIESITISIPDPYSEQINPIYKTESNKICIDKNITKLKKINKVKDVIIPPWIDSPSRSFYSKNFDLTFQEFSKLDNNTLSISNLRFIDQLSISKPKNPALSEMILIYDIYNYWVNYFTENKIDMIFGSIEHSSIDSLLFQAAKESGVPKILIPYATGNIDNLNQRTYYILNLANNMPESLTNNEKINEVRIFGNLELEKFIYKTQDKNIFNKIYKTIKLNPHILFNTKLFTQKASVVLSKNKYIKQIKLISKHYNSISNSPDFNEKYIIYYLHYEPEASTLPIAERYSNQLLNIRILASSLPKNWKLYVKEHPAQLNIGLNKKLGYNRWGKDFPKYKNKQFYDYINSLNNVKLISINTNQKDLIQNAQIISSINGSVIIEASNFNKPCIMFSEKSLYSLFNNTWVVKDTNECKLAINEILQSNEIKSNLRDLLKKYTFWCPPEQHSLEILIDILNHNSKPEVKTSKIISTSLTENS